MFICKDCERTFLDPEIMKTYERHSELDGPGPKVEVFTEELCPYCRSSRIEEGYECDICGNYTEFGEYGNFCPDCLHKATQAVESLQAALQTNWNTAVGLMVEWSERNW